MRPENKDIFSNTKFLEFLQGRLLILLQEQKIQEENHWFWGFSTELLDKLEG